MKKLNLWLGTIACFVFFFGNYFKIQHWPSAGVLLLLGSILGIIFLLMYLFGDLNLLNEGKEKTNVIIGSITMIVALVAFTFKTQHWPGANILVYIGHALFLIFGIYYFIETFNEKDANKQALKMFSAFIFFILMSILILLGLGSLMK